VPIATASQTIGPYWHILEDKTWADLTRFGAEGEKIVLTGRVLDGDGKPCSDACVEIWQSDPPASDSFPGFGRANTDAAGVFQLVTIKPGPVPGRGNATQAPHLEVSVFARGLLDRLITRVYFPDEPLNDQDPVLGSIPDKTVRRTLIARLDGDAAETDSVPTYVFDIRLQGEGETAFFDA